MKNSMKKLLSPASLFRLLYVRWRFARATPHIKEGTCWKDAYRKPRALRNACCCNCEFHYVLKGHPWVNGNNADVGWVCTAQIFMKGTRVELSQAHGLCELHEPLKKPRANDA